MPQNRTRRQGWRGRRGGQGEVCARGTARWDVVGLMGVVALGGALLLPALSRAEQAEQAEGCLKTQRGLAIAMLTYASDQDEHLPRPLKGSVDKLSDEHKEQMLWYQAVDAYLPVEPVGEDADEEAERERQAALTLKKQDPLIEQWDAAKRAANRTLKMNTYLRDDADARYRARLRDIGDPSQTVLVVDGRAADWHETDVFSGRRYDASEGLVAPRHEDAANVAFVDGSVRRVEQELREDLAAPGWFTEPDDRQELTWRVYGDEDEDEQADEHANAEDQEQG